MRLNEIESEFSVDAYHGTDQHFDRFDPRRTGDIGLHFGTAEQADRINRNHWSAGYRDNAVILPVKLRLKNPLRVKDQFSTLRKTFINRAKTWSLDTRGFRMTPDEREALYDAAEMADKARKRGGGDWNIVLDKSKAAHRETYQEASRRFWAIIEQSLRRQGYDGLIYSNRAEGKGDSYVVLDANQVRSRWARFDPEKAQSDHLMDDRQ